MVYYLPRQQHSPEKTKIRCVFLLKNEKKGKSYLINDLENFGSNYNLAEITQDNHWLPYGTVQYSWCLTVLQPGTYLGTYLN